MSIVERTLDLMQFQMINFILIVFILSLDIFVLSTDNTNDDFGNNSLVFNFFMIDFLSYPVRQVLLAAAAAADILWKIKFSKSVKKKSQTKEKLEKI